jgi:hypothetical protein
MGHEKLWHPTALEKVSGANPGNGKHPMGSRIGRAAAKTGLGAEHESSETTLRLRHG